MDCLISFEFLSFYSEILLAVTVTPSVRRGSFHKDCFVKNRLEAELSQTTRCPTMYFQPNTGNTETLSHKYMKYRYTQNRKMAKERYLYQEKTLVGVEPNNQIIDNVFFTKYRRQVFSQKYMSYSSVTFQEPRKRCMTHSQMLGKFEYTRGPIFKVVLEC